MRTKPVLDTQQLVKIAKRRGLVYLALFGSYARGDADSESDIDLYARFDRRIGLFEMLSVKHEMEDALGVGVDLITEEVVEPYSFVRDAMAKDLIVLFDDEREVEASTR